MQVLELGPRVRVWQVQNKEEETTALYVTQKRDAKSSVEVGSSNDAWDVSNYTEGDKIWINALQW